MICKLNPERRYKQELLAACLLLLSLLSQGASAHPLAPSLLQFEASEPGRFIVSWKTPLKKAAGSRLQPVLPEHCQPVGEVENFRAATAMVFRWEIDCGDKGLVGSTIQVAGIATSKADVLLRIGLHDGRSLHQVLDAGQEQFVVPERQPWTAIFGSYLWLGVEHLIGGIDHVLFVLALFMLVGVRKSLIWTVTMFTLGHSVTLSLATLGYIRFSQSVAEVFIALSIIVAFTEVVRRDSASVANWKAYLMAGGFGLLHGLGFASALREVGLPAGDIPLALLAFNVGIEVGQLAIIALLCILSVVLVRAGVRWIGWWKTIPIYTAGSLAGFWFWQRLALVLS